jgi:hypothetical protein
VKRQSARHRYSRRGGYRDRQRPAARVGENAWNHDRHRTAAGSIAEAEADALQPELTICTQNEIEPQLKRREAAARRAGQELRREERRFDRQKL